MKNESTLAQNSNYTTKDTALAAYLYSEGFTLLDVDTSSHPAFFVFEDTSDKLHLFIRQYQTGKAEGNIPAFYRAYKVLLRRLRDNP